MSNQEIYRTTHTNEAQTYRHKVNNEEDKDLTHQHSDDDDDDEQLTHRHSDDDVQDIDQTMYCDEGDEHANDALEFMVSPSMRIQTPSLAGSQL